MGHSFAALLGLPSGFLLGYMNFPAKKLLRLLSDTLLSFPIVLIGLIVSIFITCRVPLGEYGLLFTLPFFSLEQGECVAHDKSGRRG